MHTSFSELDTESDYNIYSKHLASLGYGIPLWQPAPLSDYKRVRIADVGYVRTGQFYRLFNASLPSDDPAQNRGVPANFHPLQLDDVCSQHKQPRLPGVLSSKDMRLEGVDFDVADDPAWLESEKTVRLESSRGHGAILVTRDITVREDALQLGFLEDYMTENYESWLEMANMKLGRGIKLEELILVTGCDLTTQSTMAAFDTGGSAFAITFKAAKESPAFSTWGSWHTLASGAVFKNFCGRQRLASPQVSSNLAPEAFSPSMHKPGFSVPDYDEFNQCIFLRGFRIRTRRIQVSSFPEEFTDLGRDNLNVHENALGLDHVESSEAISVEAISDKHPFEDPLEPYFERILENTEVQKAVLHDNVLSIPHNVEVPPEDCAVQKSLLQMDTMDNNEVWRITSPPEPSKTSDAHPICTPGSPSPPPSRSTEPADWTIPPAPAGLRGVSAYLQRAQELKLKNPVIAYWCIYFVAKKGLSSTLQDENSWVFFNQIMAVLEKMKADLGSNDAILHDGASAKYIANFALRIFKKADSEDQRRKATRSTAKKFLASANFFELLRLFERPMEADVEEKIHYAKWKAADIAKAFRDGRIPTPGNFHASSRLSSNDSVATPAASEMLDLPHEAMSAWSPGASVALSLAPSPALQGLKSLESSPVAEQNILPCSTPELGTTTENPERCLGRPTSSPPLQEKAPSPGSTCIPAPHVSAADNNPDRAALSPTKIECNDDGRMGAFIWNSNEERQRVDSNEEPERAEEESSTAAVQSAIHQSSRTLTGDANMIPEGGQLFTMQVPGLELGFQPDEPPPVAIRKRVRFSPSVVGGLSSKSSSVAASSPPASPERYAPTLPTVPETGYSSEPVAGEPSSKLSSVAASSPPPPPEHYVPTLPTVPEGAYSSDSDRERGVTEKSRRSWQDPASIPLPESTVSESSISDSDSDSEEGWRHGVPPVITKVPSPTPPSPIGPSSTKTLSQGPSLQVTAASPQFYSTLPRFLAGLSPNPAATPALHPTPRFFPHTLALYPRNDTPPSPSDGSASPDVDSAQVTQAQRHCRFAISALDYQDANAARDEIRAALSMLDEGEHLG